MKFSASEHIVVVSGGISFFQLFFPVVVLEELPLFLLDRRFVARTPGCRCQSKYVNSCPCTRPSRACAAAVCAVSDFQWRRVELASA